MMWEIVRKLYLEGRVRSPHAVQGEDEGAGLLRGKGYAPLVEDWFK